MAAATLLHEPEVGGLAIPTSADGISPALRGGATPEVSELAGANHICQMFEDDAFPARRIAEYLDESLRRGGAAVAIATEAHTEEVSAALRQLGVDVPDAVRSGRLVLRDATRFAASLVDAAGINAERFAELIAQPVTETLARHGSARLYGEIVDLLSRSGQVQRAIELEQAWNELLAGKPAQLLCGYALHSFADLDSAEAFAGVCDLHDCVEPVAEKVPSADRGRIVAELQRTSSALANEALRRRGLEAQRDLLAGAEQLANSRAQRSDDEAQRAQQRLRLLTDAMQRFAAARLDLSDVLDAIADEVARPDFAQCCVIYLCDDGGGLRLAAIRDLHATAADSAQSRSAVIEIPLRASGELLGTLTAYRYEPNPAFTEDDRQLLEQIASRAALAVENALLYARAQEERQRAELANRTKDEFMAMLGHELRNPLSPILTAVQLMRLRAGETLTKERTIIERQVNRMVRLVDDLLDVSRITRGKVQLKRAPVEIASVIAEAIEIASPLLEERAHKLVTSVPSAGLRVDADSDRLEQVISNLLTNAAKYTPPGGKIEVAARVHHGMVAISVRDNGAGIEPHVLPKIFELFAQAEQPSDRALGGLGLGLAIARSLVELHGGKLYARSDGAGLGSEFTLELPLLRGAQARPGRHDDAAEGRRHPPLKVLVVDDNRDAAEALLEALDDMGLAGKMAHDGPSALEIAREFRPDLALLDIGLPVMDGYELCRRLAALAGDSSLKTVAVTGYGQKSDRLRASAAGFDAHLVKPVDLDRLEAVIAELAPGET